MLNYYNSKVTLELRELIENGVKIWDFDYPSYYKDDEKTAFEQKVIDHFYFRQIGQETVGRFKFMFKARMREIMPYYIQIYKSCELLDKENPLESYNLTETFKELKKGTETNSETRTDSSETGETSTNSETRSDTSETTSSVSEEHSETGSKDSTRKFSNTPQGLISNLDNYMTEAETNEENNTSTKNSSSEASASASHSGTSSITNEVTASISANGTTARELNDEEATEYTLERRGNIGVQPLGQEIKILREAYLNVDMMIINDLNDLFLRVY